MPELFDYQVDVLARGRARMRGGARRVIIQADCGAGKTHIIAEVARCAAALGKRVLILAHRRKLIKQIRERLSEFKVPHGVLMSGFFVATNAVVLIGSRDTLISRGLNLLPDAELVVVDECFVAGTPIATPTGSQPIEQLRAGDRVHCASGVGVVKAVGHRMTSDLYRVEFSDGSEFTCTGNHPVFTERGWVQTRELEEGSLAYRQEDVRLLWQRVRTATGWGAQGAGGAADPERGRVAAEGMLLEILREETQEPHDGSAGATQGERPPERDTTQADQTRRERATSTTGPARPAPRFGRRLGGGGCGADDGAARQRLSDVLQDRHCQPGNDDRLRVRRHESHNVWQEGSGREEGGTSPQPRVVRVSRLERTGRTPVFNLRVSGHPSYFAHGKLVHNCHNLPADSYMAIATRYPRAHLLGFTATPCDSKGNGLGRYFDAMECAVPTSELIRRGRLVPARCYAPKGLSEKRKRSRRSRGLAGDVVSHWQEYAEGRRTLLFAGNKTTSLACTKRFLDEGIKAEHIDAFTPDDDDESREDTRDAVMRRLKAAETLVVCNVGLWTEGVDIPEIDAIIIFRAMESFRFYKQAVSRGMRSCAGKTDCVVLDHSGAVEYHGFPDNDVRWTLDPGQRVEERNTADMDEGRQRTPVTCPRCGGMFDTASPTCPFCGFVLRKAKDALANVNRDERLVELDREYESVNTEDIMTRQWRAYIGMVKARGQNLSVAAAMFRGRFKKMPWEAGVSPMPTDRACWKMTVAEVWPEWGKKPVEEF